MTPIIGEYVNPENIKDLLHVGDEVILDDKYRCTVTYLYWEDIDKDDLGFKTNHPNHYYQIICDEEIRGGTILIEKMT